MKKCRKEIFISIKEMNLILKSIRINKRPIVYGEYRMPIQGKVFIEDNMVQFSITMKEESKTVTYVTRKDELENTQVINGGEAFKIMQRYHKTPKAKAPFSATAIMYHNKKYVNTRNKAYGYDLNSAYSYAMLQTMPDIENVLEPGVVQENEIGFDANGKMIEKDYYALYRFPLIESPYKKFVEVWYNKKTNPKDKKEKNKAKNVLNFSIGSLQNNNPFIRSRIISLCNKLIESLIDENTLYCNTDSLVSLVPRDDLEIGNGIGQWKIEKIGMFAYKGFGMYQWDDKVSYSGRPKSWFKKDFDILKDNLPKIGNTYYYDKDKIKLIKGDYNGKR